MLTPFQNQTNERQSKSLTRLDWSLLDKRINARLDKIRSVIAGGTDLCCAIIICSNLGKQIMYAKQYGLTIRGSPVLKTGRNVGSTLKIALYTAFLDRFPIPTTEIFNDAPVSINWQGKVLIPRNSDNKFRGEVELKYAFANSINTVALQIIERLGVSSFIHYLRRCGITCPLPNSPLLALGPIRLNGLELLSTLSPILNYGHTTLAFEEQLISGYAAHMMKDLLKETVIIGTGQYLKTRSKCIFGGKTGTSDDSKDCWFIGQINTELCGVVWIGKEDESRIVTMDAVPASASRFAVPLWGEILDFYELALGE